MKGDRGEYGQDEGMRSETGGPDIDPLLQVMIKGSVQDPDP
jgi:hypothetical protein